MTWCAGCRSYVVAGWPHDCIAAAGSVSRTANDNPAGQPDERGGNA